LTTYLREFKKKYLSAPGRYKT